MSRFLSVISVDEARKVLISLASPLPAEKIPLFNSNGRILAEDIISDVDIPGFNRSTVDGYAVSSSDTTGAGESIPVMLKLSGILLMGKKPEQNVKPGYCMYCPTGAFLPEGADAVVMIEYCEEMADDVLVFRSVASGENVIYRGEDFSNSKPAICKGTRINSRVMGVLAACGVPMVPVSMRPRVAIISTGNEIVPVDEVPGEGNIRDVNTYLCAGYVEEAGGVPVIIGIVQDERDPLEEALNNAVEISDVILISGGSSKGERDMCADIIENMGKVLVHGIALSPGKPTIIGNIQSKPVIGLPGHPASVYVVLMALIRVLISTMTGEKIIPAFFSGILTSPVPSSRGREDYIRVKRDGENIFPVFGKSGLINTLISSDGLLKIPADEEGFEQNSRVFLELWR